MPVLIKASRHHPFMALFMLASLSVAYFLAAPDQTQALNAEKRTTTEGSAISIKGYSKAGSYLAARFARQYAHQKDAAQLLSEALSHDPRNLDLRRDTVRQLVIAGQAGEAITQVNKIPAMVHTHPLTRLIMLAHYLEQKQTEKATALIKAHKAVGILGLLEPVAQQWLALDLGDKALLPMTDSAFAQQQSGYAEKLLNYHMGLLNHAAAYDDIAHQQLQAATADITAVPARMVYNYVNFLQQTNRPALAEAMIERYHQRFTNSHHLPKGLETFNANVEAHTMPTEGKEGIAEILFSVGNVLFSANNIEDTQFYLQLSLFLRPDFAPAQLLLARVSEMQKQYSNAISYYQGIHPESIYAHQAAREIAINAYHMADIELAEEQFERLQQRFSANEKDLMAYGNMKREQGKFEEATQAYTQAIILTAEQKRPMWQLYFARGASFEQMGDWEKAEADLQKALALDPNQPDVLNYLGYSWADKGNNLDKAREYVARALRMAPNAGHIVDSMGWIEYRRGQFDLAVKYLEHAALLTPNDPTVNDHLGDALYRVGRKEEAKFQWQRALTFEPDEALKISLDKKLLSGLDEFVVPELTSNDSEAAQIEPTLVDDVNVVQ